MRIGSTITIDYPLAVAKGLVAGAEMFYGFGEKSVVSASSGIIWPGGTFYIPPASGVQPSLVSTSLLDIDTTGTGAKKVIVHYLDSNLDPHEEIVSMSALVPAQMVATDVRFIQCLHVYETGVGLSAAGLITAVSGANVMSEILAGDVRCRSSARMVPRGKTAFVNAIAGGTASAEKASGNIEIVSTEIDGVSFVEKGLFFPFGENMMQDSTATIVLPQPARFQEGSIIAMKFKVDKATTVTGTWYGWIEDAT